MWSQKRVTHAGGHNCAKIISEKQNFVRNIRKFVILQWRAKEGVGQ